MDHEIYRINGILPKIYGPYKYKTGRKHIVLSYSKKEKFSKPYARYLMEVYLGRLLDGRNETVDHIDGDKTNDVIENLQILTLSDNVKKSFRDGSSAKRPIEYWKGFCPNCNTEFIRRADIIRGNRKLGKSGPFCGINCSSYYGRLIQLGQKEKIFTIGKTFFGE